MKIEEGTETMEISRSSKHQFYSREDCWSEDSSSALIDAWGDRHLELKRGNLRQKDWLTVADSVNTRRGTGKKAPRTDIQCKNRIDTLKKKYKLERAIVLSSDGALTSNWPFYSRLDSFVGTPVKSKVLAGTPVLPYRKPLSGVPYASEVKVYTHSAKEKRRLPSVPVDELFFRRNYSSVAAAAAATATARADSGLSRSSSESQHKDEEVDGFRVLAQAIERLGEIYERVEEAKQRQLIELEKQRMDFMKDLEFEWMQFMDTQVQLAKIKRATRDAANDSYL